MGKIVQLNTMKYLLFFCPVLKYLWINLINFNRIRAQKSHIIFEKYLEMRTVQVLRQYLPQFLVYHRMSNNIRNLVGLCQNKTPHLTHTRFSLFLISANKSDNHEGKREVRHRNFSIMQSKYCFHLFIMAVILKQIEVVVANIIPVFQCVAVSVIQLS